MTIKSVVRLHQVTEIHQCKYTLRVYTSVLHFFIRTAFLYQLFETGTSEHHKCIVQRLSQVSPYTPFHFSFKVPLTLRSFFIQNQKKHKSRFSYHIN